MSPPGQLSAVEQLGGKRQSGGGLADALRADQEQRVRQLLVDPARHQRWRTGPWPITESSVGHGMDVQNCPR